MDSQQGGEAATNYLHGDHTYTKSIFPSFDDLNSGKQEVALESKELWNLERFRFTNQREVKQINKELMFNS